MQTLQYMAVKDVELNESYGSKSTAFIDGESYYEPLEIWASTAGVEYCEPANIHAPSEKPHVLIVHISHIYCVIILQTISWTICNTTHRTSSGRDVSV